jgi:hypothetical protein
MPKMRLPHALPSLWRPWTRAAATMHPAAAFPANGRRTAGQAATCPRSSPAAWCRLRIADRHTVAEKPSDDGCNGDLSGRSHHLSLWALRGHLLFCLKHRAILPTMLTLNILIWTALAVGAFLALRTVKFNGR